MCAHLSSFVGYMTIVNQNLQDDKKDGGKKSATQCLQKLVQAINNMKGKGEPEINTRKDLAKQCKDATDIFISYETRTTNAVPPSSSPHTPVSVEMMVSNRRG